MLAQCSPHVMTHETDVHEPLNRPCMLLGSLKSKIADPVHICMCISPVYICMYISPVNCTYLYVYICTYIYRYCEGLWVLDSTAGRLRQILVRAPGAGSWPGQPGSRIQLKACIWHN